MCGFPLSSNIDYERFVFQVFADHETSINPIIFRRELCDGLEKRALYCGSSVLAIFRLLDTRRIQLCFWTGNKFSLIVKRLLTYEVRLFGTDFLVMCRVLMHESV